MSVSQAVINSDSHNERLQTILKTVTNLRIQLSGEFPSKATDFGTFGTVEDNAGLISALMSKQAYTDYLIGEIEQGLEAIHPELGQLYHPLCQDEKACSEARL